MKWEKKEEGNYKKTMTFFLQSRKSRNTAESWLNKKEEFYYIKASFNVDRFYNFRQNDVQ